MNHPHSSTFDNMSWKDKIKFYVSNITVEPVVTLYFLPNILAALAMQNLNLEKACRVNLNYGEHVCDAITLRQTVNLTDQEQQVQRLAAQMGYWQPLLQSALPALLILFLGSFSDRTGRRKPFMLLPMFGELFTAVGLILCTYFYYDWSMEVTGIIEVIFPALTGGSITMLMAVFSYMGDITDAESRTMRLSVINIFTTVTLPVGTLAGGYLLKAIGFYGVFTTAASMYTFALLYGALRLKEARQPKKLSTLFIKEMFDPTHVVDTFMVVFKSRKGNLRLRLILVLILYICLMGPGLGDSAVGYYFLRRRFNWDEVDFSLYSTYTIIIDLIGTSLIIGLFTRLLKVDDNILGLIACMGRIVAKFFLAFASTPLSFYLITLIDVVGVAALITLRSIASKLVPSEELGKIYSLFGAGEAVVPIIYKPVYSFVYQRTIKELPGAFFLLSAALLVPTVIIYGYLYYLQRKDLSSKTDDHSHIEQPSNSKTNEALDISEEFLNTCSNTKL